MSNTYTNLLYHVVFSTKFRLPTIDSTWQSALHKYIGGIIRERDGISLQVGGMPDHVHVLAKLCPKFAVMDVIRDIKANSSKWVNDQHLSKGRFEWQMGYGAFSVSRSNVDEVQHYIRTQPEHHRQMSFKTELLEFLKRHGVEFDLKYVFDEEHFA